MNLRSLVWPVVPANSPKSPSQIILTHLPLPSDQVTGASVVLTDCFSGHMKTLLLTALLLTNHILRAAPPVRPDEINVAGSTVKTDGCCLAWKPDKAAEIAGTYESASFTDAGSSTLVIKATGEGDKILLTGKLVTKSSADSESVITFTHGELVLEEEPRIKVAGGILTGWLVQFASPEGGGAKPQPSIILNGDVYVRKE